MINIQISLCSVVKEYRKRLSMTYRDFAEAINEHLVGTGISHQTISNWEKSITDPTTDFLLTCLVVHDDWRRQFAIDCLCAKLPEVFIRNDNSIALLVR
jgi:transcriptional regulator with XRE-family HTH domain